MPVLIYASHNDIIAPFSGGSLCGLFEEDDGCESLFIGKVIQKTVIYVHEIGVEAAAVTSVLIGRSAPLLEDHVSMMCDHPFQFFIYDKTDNLFEGRLSSPEIQETEPAVPFWIRCIQRAIFGRRHLMSILQVHLQIGWSQATNSSSIRSYISVRNVSL